MHFDALTDHPLIPLLCAMAYEPRAPWMTGSIGGDHQQHFNMRVHQQTVQQRSHRCGWNVSSRQRTKK
jgi:hypothetical protein